MIWAPTARSSSGVRPFTLACVPTGRKAGVSTVPWGVLRRPTRAGSGGGRPPMRNSRLNGGGAPPPPPPAGPPPPLDDILARRPVALLARADARGGHHPGRHAEQVIEHRVA